MRSFRVCCGDGDGDGCVTDATDVGVTGVGVIGMIDVDDW